jgi:hypothetical protein
MVKRYEIRNSTAEYRIVQDRLFQSDFDKYLGALPLEGEDDSKTE